MDHFPTRSDFRIKPHRNNPSPRNIRRFMELPEDSNQELWFRAMPEDFSLLRKDARLYFMVDMNMTPAEEVGADFRNKDGYHNFVGKIRVRGRIMPATYEIDYNYENSREGVAQFGGISQNYLKIVPGTPIGDARIHMMQQASE